MLILADENMHFAREAFSTLGEVRLARGREITSEAVRDCEVLAVRSVTRVDERLLAGSRVRFVGTATIGTDHIDTAWLSRAGIGFASAPGSNAVSVAEYVVAALFVLAERLDFRLEGKSLGIIGVGNVGSRVAARAEALGLRVVLNDPPLAAKTGDPRYRGLEAALACDIITLHVPLEKCGPYPTYHLVDEKFIERLKPGAILFNTSRGAVVRTAALEAGLGAGKPAAAVLDVWESEPEISLALMERTAITTPHIAGYSYDGKVRGTRMIYEAASAHFGRKPSWTEAGALPVPAKERLTLEGNLSRAQELIGAAVRESYDILADDRKLRKIGTLVPGERAGWFDSLRKNYPVRREWESRTVVLGRGLESLEPRLKGLGFRVEIAGRNGSLPL